MQDYRNEKLIIDPDNIKYGTVSWLSPSNIALVKYWGKHGTQLPMNPSISLTLSTSHTQTKIEYGPRKDMSLPLEFSFEFEGKEKPEFRSRIENYLLELKEIFSFLSQLSLDISSKNSYFEICICIIPGPQEQLVWQIKLKVGSIFQPLSVFLKGFGCLIPSELCSVII